jgi:hypothetical protein
MSKAEVKKYIKSLERNSLEELVMDLYSARKEAKEYLENVIKPNDKGKLEDIERLSRKNSVPVVVMPNCASPSVVRQFRNINRLIQHQNFWQI